ncbi:helix-turn-helix transcriptional regulator [Actinomadura sp. CNU-125]|uniref:helix-turn-helix transcriptional regulator n=1 Tax=Actinomadura sp. CNU-125 TaxID=1904961 RepID=UPI001301374C|nr:AraC family transcriptional regulator [Actinomadura sp. CNU-125]
MFAGAIDSAALHSHTAIQILIVGSGRLVLQDAAGSEQPADAAIIPSGVAHAVHATQPTFGVTAYLDPASRLGTAARARTARSPADRADVRTWVQSAAPIDPQPDATNVPSRSSCAELTSARAILDLPARRDAHPALTEVMEALPNLVNGPMTLQGISEHVGYPPRVLERLFLEEYGLPYSVWRRWARLEHGITLLRQGKPLTDAARSAGFSDSSHFTLVCSSVFGIRPSDAAAITVDQSWARPTSVGRFIDLRAHGAELDAPPPRTGPASAAL